MDQDSDKAWRFRVTCPHADRVFLVKESNSAGKTWLPMKPMGFDIWELDLGLSPGYHQFSYFTAEGETFFNGGSHGLTVTHQGDPDPRVIVEPMGQPMTA